MEIITGLQNRVFGAADFTGFLPRDFIGTVRKVRRNVIRPMASTIISIHPNRSSSEHSHGLGQVRSHSPRRHIFDLAYQQIMQSRRAQKSRDTFLCHDFAIHETTGYNGQRANWESIPVSADRSPWLDSPAAASQDDDLPSCPNLSAHRHDAVVSNVLWATAAGDVR